MSTPYRHNEGTHMGIRKKAQAQTSTDDGEVPIEKVRWAQEKLDVSTSKIYEMARAGSLPGCFKVGRMYRVNVKRFWAEIDEASR